MLKSMFLSSVAVAALSLSPVNAMMRDHEDDNTKSSSTSQQAVPTQVPSQSTSSTSSLNEDKDSVSSQSTALKNQKLEAELLRELSQSFPVDVTDSFLETEGLTRKEFDHFFKQSSIQLSDKIHQTLKGIDLQLDEGARKAKATSVILPDNNFEGRVQKGYKEYKLLVQELKQTDRTVKSLKFKWRGLTVLPPLTLWSEFKNLEELDLSGNALTNVNPIIRLESLKTLELDNNPSLRKFPSLVSPKTLESINLGNTGITDLRGVEHYQRLTNLILNRTPINDITHLAASRGVPLKELTLWYAPDLWRPLPGETVQDAERRIESNRLIVDNLKSKGCDVLIHNNE